MKNSEAVEKYKLYPRTKSGIIFDHGKCVYLHNDACFEAKCHRVLLRADKKEILAEWLDELVITRCET